MPKPSFDLNRPFSWSAISSFKYDPEQWYRKYVLKKEDLPSAEMLFGSEVGRRIANDRDFLPELRRQSLFEYEEPHGLRCTLDGIPLIGFIDSYEPHQALDEYKTGKKEWDQKRVDDHGQLTMYLLMLFVKYGVRPEDVDVMLHWIPTKETGDFRIDFRSTIPEILSFRTKRTMQDLMRFGGELKATYKAMQLYAKNHG